MKRHCVSKEHFLLILKVHTCGAEVRLTSLFPYSTDVGDAVGSPPSARCEASVTEGMSPLDVTIDMSDR